MSWMVMLTQILLPVALLGWIAFPGFLLREVAVDVIGGARSTSSIARAH